MNSRNALVTAMLLGQLQSKNSIQPKEKVIPSKRLKADSKKKAKRKTAQASRRANRR